MSSSAGWDWETPEKFVADVSEWKKQFVDVREVTPTDDGEKIAAIVKNQERRFTTCVNGEIWEETFERVYSLRFNPDNQLIALAFRDYEWSVVVDREMWEEKFDFVWNLTLSPDGKSIAVNINKDQMSGVCLNGTVWENTFFEARDVAISPDGQRTASHVLIRRRVELDNIGFLKKNWTVAVDGTAWSETFLNTWGAIFSSDGQHVAAVVRTDLSQYTIAVDEKPWDFVSGGCVWEPVFRPGTADVVAPVQTPQGFTMAMNGKPIWGYFNQVWKQKFTNDGKKLAAVVAAGVGNWTVAVDGTPWNTFFNQFVAAPVFSPDGSRVAAGVLHNKRWTIAVDGNAWSDVFDNVWDPVFSPAGDKVAAKVEKNGKFFIVVDGKTGKKGYEALWDPAFSPDGKKVLVRCIDGGKYYRRVIPVNEI